MYKPILIQGIDFFDLESVGSRIDMHTGDIYPINQDGTIDYSLGSHVDEIETNHEWWDALSELDRMIIDEYLSNYKQGYRAAKF